MDPVEIQVQPGDRRIVAQMVGLARVDFGHIGQRVVPDLEAARDLAQAERGKLVEQRVDIVGAERRIAAARENQVALQPALAQRPGRQEPGAEPVGRAEMVERIGGGDRLAGARGHHPLIGPVTGQDLAADRVAQLVGHLAAQPEAGDQRIGFGAEIAVQPSAAPRDLRAKCNSPASAGAVAGEWARRRWSWLAPGRRAGQGSRMTGWVPGLACVGSGASAWCG